MKIIYSPKCLEYQQTGHPESPERVGKVYDFLRANFDFLQPERCSAEDILRVHAKGFLSKVESSDFYDDDTPSLPGMYDFAKLAAGAAMLAAKTSFAGESAFSLMRPPGHHAGKDFLGGFCYFNNMAIAIRFAQEKLGVKNVLLLDIDCHHGNGTQDIFLGDSNVRYVSLHQSPLYPGTGLESQKNCFNFPLTAGTTGKEYLQVFEKALISQQDFNPDLIGVSAGFDTYKDDPLTDMSLEQQTYGEIGSMISQLGAPVFTILEGGYSRDMPSCVYEYLKGVSGI